MKTIHFISGLPRSGSTLLTNILAQNPHFRVAGTSPLVDVLLNIRNCWDQLQEAQAMPREDSAAAKLRVLRGAMLSYWPPLSYPRTWEPTDFDKSRTWLAHIEMAEAILGHKVKVLVPVRDVRDILCSLELFWRRHPLRQMPSEARNYFGYQSAPGRVAAWMAADGILGIAYSRVRDALQRGLGDRLHLVHYEQLTQAPHYTLSAIYDFLGAEHFAHDFEHVQSATREDDTLAYGMPGLHDIRHKVQPAVSRWQEVLGEIAGVYGPLNDALGYERNTR